MTQPPSPEQYPGQYPGQPPHPSAPQPYQGGPYQGGPYQGGPYQGGPYQGGPYQGGYQPGPYGPPPGKRRPSAWWFLPGALSVLLAIGCVVVAIVTAVGMFHTEGYLFADDQPHPFTLESGDHMLFTPDGGAAPACSVDAGGPVAVRTLNVADQETLNIRGIDWRPFARFSSEGGNLEITCTGDAEQVRVGSPAGVSQFVVIGVTVIGGLALGVLGIVGLIVVAVLYFTRKPRSVTG